jgi:predicted enzyme related to lactoylglutathione lyase
MSQPSQPSQSAFQPDLCIRYVADAAASSTFYAGLFGRAPMHAENDFVMFRFDTGLRLGLWSRAAAGPQPLAGGGGAELAILVPDAGTVEAAHRDWTARGVAILQAPLDADFGRTFVAADPDGHRIRVYAFAPPQ